MTQDFSHTSRQAADRHLSYVPMGADLPEALHSFCGATSRPHGDGLRVTFCFEAWISGQEAEALSRFCVRQCREVGLDLTGCDMQVDWPTGRHPHDELTILVYTLAQSEFLAERPGLLSRVVHRLEQKARVH